ncbi:hypothetical protein V6N11_023179 [Hibiscus sabdariffa]|uniref:RNase H type-1 domain-containing protein n=2 Tax=Hibiscus sabdariffa TaxID=183260 RepID=A0ABR2AFF2_9ROSI
MFSKSVGCIDASSTELFVIGEATMMFKRSEWAKRFQLILETDYILCSNWVREPSSTPIIFKSIVENILQFCDGLDWNIKVIQRSENTTADKLAKSEISRVSPLIWVRPR